MRHPCPKLPCAPDRKVLFVNNSAGSPDGEGAASSLRAALAHANIIQQSQTPAQRDAERRIKERQGKWDANMVHILKLFSSMGVLAELSYHPVQEPPSLHFREAGHHSRRHKAAAVMSASANIASPASGAGVLPTTDPSLAPPGRPQPRTLAASGYALPGAPQWLLQAGWCSVQGRLNLKQGHLATPPTPKTSTSKYSPRGNSGSASRSKALLGWVARPIEPVVSSCQVTCSRTMERVLSDAAAATGLHDLGRSIAVPSATIATLADARWAAVPGRYHVSRKANGTRHLLIIAADGTPYLLDRAGALYAYPLTAPGGNAHSLPPGTVLDGELVWVGTVPKPNIWAATAVTATVGAAAAICGDPGHHPNPEPAGSITAQPTPSAVEAMATGGAQAGTTTGSHRAHTSSRSGFFVVFDALAVGGAPVWQHTLDKRQEAMVIDLGLQEAEGCEQLLAAGAAARGEAAEAAEAAEAGTAGAAPAPRTAGVTGSTRYHPPKLRARTPSLALLPHAKYQQAPLVSPESGGVVLVLKRHHPVTSDTLLHLESTRDTCPYPTDGLVFTPSTMPYALGMQQLLLKWQTPATMAADIKGSVLLRRAGSAYSSKLAETTRDLINNLLPGLVYECRLGKPPTAPATSSAAAETAAAAGLTAAQVAGMQKRMREAVVTSHLPWVPVSVRWDKVVGNHPASVKGMEGRVSAGRWVSLEQLVQAVEEVQGSIASATAPSSAAPLGPPSPPPPDAARTRLVHPARAMAFDDLLTRVRGVVEAGVVEEWEEPATGLAFYSYKAPAAPTAALQAAPDASSVAPAGNTGADQEAAAAAAAAAGGLIEIVGMCRGLVLHPPTRTVVATPFVKFHEIQGGEGEGGGGGEGAVHSGGSMVAAGGGSVGTHLPQGGTGQASGTEDKQVRWNDVYTEIVPPVLV